MTSIFRYLRPVLFAAAFSCMGGSCSCVSGAAGNAGEDVQGESSAGVTRILLDKNSLELKDGETARLAVTVFPFGAEYDSLEWTSADTSVASVEDGLVTGMGNGTTLITVKAGGKSAGCEVKVRCDFRIDELRVDSPSMGTAVRTKVVVPGIAVGANSVKCPVMYLLHGAYNNADSWFRIRPDLGEIADRFGIIVVCADAGNSWYIDSPLDKSSLYETFMTSELVPFIDSRYPTVADRSGRAITGASMGGAGAMYLAMRHSALYGAAGSMSGALDFRVSSALTGMLEPILGSYNSHADDYYNYTALAQVPRISDGELNLLVDCGTEDFIFECTTKFHDELEKHGISHTYRLRPGVHDDAYWKVSLLEHIVFFSEFFNKAE
ncbi:MAG: Ig-like domain-containing protein [Bacteroidales bacterium]|nr:Ig-like domain-containing protein [Bacteroidales bacterium]